MIAVISDIHGNYPALKAVIDDIGKIGCDTIISLGDVAGYYCMINECIDLLKQKNVLNILGNHDYYLVSGEGCPRSYSANVCLEYQNKVITTDNLKWLDASIPIYERDFFSFRHGGWKDSLDEYLYVFSFDMVKDLSQTVFASGHTHIQCIKESESKTYFNPGAVGQPRDHNPRAAYAIVKDDLNVELRRVRYPVNEMIKEMRRAGFQDRISECLLYGTKIGEKI